MKKLLLIAATALWFAGCSDRNEGVGGPKEGVAIAFSLDCGSVSASVGAARTVRTASAAQPVVPAAQTAAQTAPRTVAQAAAQPSTRTAVPIATGTTVRIVALHAGDALGSTPAASATYYVTGEGTADDGHKRATLEPCSVTNDPVTGVVTAYTADATKAMRLKAGEYDFYVYSPALPLSADGKSVDVGHGIDFAASTTEGVTVKSDGTTSYPDPLNVASGAKTGSNGSVELQTLVRRCAMLSFSVDRKTTGAFSSLKIVSVKMTKMSDTPVTAAIDAAIAVPVGNSYTYTFPETSFKQGAEAYQWTFSSPVLPKKKDVYGLEMVVQYNGTSTDVSLATSADQLPALEFLAGYRYSYVLQLKGANLKLILIVGDWDDAGAWDDPGGIGAYPGTIIDIGEWVDWANPNDGIGGFVTGNASGSGEWSDTSNDNSDTGKED